MTQEAISWLMICGPAALLSAAWGNLYRTRKIVSLGRTAWIALSIVTANALWAASLFTYYHFNSVSPALPPWQDPEILDLGLLFLLAPIGMILGIIAAVSRAPKWLVFVLEVASLPLLLIGFFAVVAV